MRETAIKINGNVYRITGLTARQSQEFLEYAARHMPDPIDEVLSIAEKLPEGKAKDNFLERQLEKAMEKKKLRGSLNDPELEDFTKTPNGMKKLFGLMFRRHHPNLSEHEVFELVTQGVEENGEDTFKDLYTASHKRPLKEAEAERLFFRGDGATTEK